MNISKLENKMYEKMQENKLVVFTIKDLILLMGINKTSAYNLIKSLKKKELIKKENGFFYLINKEEFAVISNSYFPCYISFLSALNYYGLSDNTPKKILIVSTKYFKSSNLIQSVKLAKTRFFGYNSVGDMIIAEKEKAILDSLLLPKYSNGMKEVIKSFNICFSKMDKKKLISYALKMNNKAVLRRLGFLLEQNNFKEISKLKKRIGKGYELLDPSLPKKNNLNKNWLLDINV